MIKVLIVEDDPMVAELNRRYVERVEGFLFYGIVKNGEEALATLRAKNIDLVLLDIFMPNMNGLELLSAIRQQEYSVDVIVVSAARDNQSIQMALRNGAVDYLIKPFEFERMQTALINFKKRLQLIREASNLSQNLLDQQIFARHSQIEGELPKGLDRNTIKRVWEHILEQKDEFTAEEMANYVGLSPVSIRKYLKYFQSVDLLHVEISYGAVGRPVYRYRCNRNR
ncbi:MAG: response regulator receiver and unknown domain protein [Firmicutes bacterium]|uniref:Transcriptional regulatory protein n=2 Tax=Pelosinus TaxID=365348 RepID=I9NQ18_9FIRM|nr:MULTISPECIES: response regulator [Pelosinus]AJQ28247.1 response regulator receiver and unknown domain protein [Pelosinus fermentans JBW45]MBP2659545.1 response regulator receiver and unknown domain protein [Bacillota bacterium]MCC5465161.1 response regulator [Pelosinus baikalensis]MCC5465224.1 response regulator [Pelosinus baikalensis]